MQHPDAVAVAIGNRSAAENERLASIKAHVYVLRFFEDRYDPLTGRAVVRTWRLSPGTSYEEACAARDLEVRTNPGVRMAWLYAVLPVMLR